MNLDETQMTRVRQWIDEGLKVAEIQNRLGSEFGLQLTYMEARLLLDDLKLRPKDPPPPPPQAAAAPGSILTQEPPAGAPSNAATPQPGSPSKPGGGVSITVDNIARPGAIVSGKVTFKDGQGAEWQLNQMGQLGLVPSKPGYKPTQQDIAEFQRELDGVLVRMGF
jgi:hypothetical protein